MKEDGIVNRIVPGKRLAAAETFAGYANSTIALESGMVYRRQWTRQHSRWRPSCCWPRQSPWPGTGAAGALGCPPPARSVRIGALRAGGPGFHLSSGEPHAPLRPPAARSDDDPRDTTRRWTGARLSCGPPATRYRSARNTARGAAPGTGDTARRLLTPRQSEDQTAQVLRNKLPGTAEQDSPLSPLPVFKAQAAPSDPPLASETTCWPTFSPS